MSIVKPLIQQIKDLLLMFYVRVIDILMLDRFLKETLGSMQA